MWSVYLCASATFNHRHLVTVNARSVSPSRLPALSGTDAVLEYYIIEERPAHTLVGNVPRDFKLNERYTPPVADGLFNFRFLSRAGLADRKLFAIDESTGVIRTTERIDREAICRSKLSEYSTFTNQNGNEQRDTGLHDLENDEACYFTFDVIVQPMRYFRIVRVRVEIVDINDNAPSFPRPLTELRLSESAEQGASLPIDAAQDRDAGANGQCEYRLESLSDERGGAGINHFRLTVDFLPDGAVRLKLVLIDQLDFETVEQIRLVVVATDGGYPVRLSGSTVVDVHIVDINDNSPEFRPTSHFRAAIAEDVPTGFAVVQLSAIDRDASHNTDLRYSLVDRSAAEYGHIFGIRPETGLVYTRKLLDRETAPDAYRLYVVVHDSGGQEAEGALSAHALVEVEIIDVNDNAPRICMRPPAWSTVTPFQRSTVTSSLLGAGYGNATGIESGVECRTDVDSRGFIVYQTFGDIEGDIEGDIDNGLDEDNDGDDVISFVAHVTVDDPDDGNNSRFQCELSGDGAMTFQLRQLYSTEYVIVVITWSDLTAANKSISAPGRHVAGPGDQTYSDTAVREFSIVCRDNGQPEMSSSVDVRILKSGSVLQFSSVQYLVEIEENNQIGVALTQLTVTCLYPMVSDRIRYRIVSTPEGGTSDEHKEPIRKMIAIGAASGLITAVTSFDRERTPFIEFSVIAEIISGDNVGQTTDGHRRLPLPAGTALTHVRITVRDVDDERPKFDRKHYSFSIAENQADGATVGHLAAVDRDTFPFNRVVYSLDPNADQTFGINPTSGYLFARLPLDRERQSSYRIVVTVASPAAPPDRDDDDLNYYADSVNVDVQVDDVNDNPPRFLFPVEHDDDVVRLRSSDFVTSGHVIACLRAVDDDTGNNARVVYRIVGERVIVLGVERDVTLRTTSGLFRVDPDSGNITVAPQGFRYSSMDLTKPGTEFLIGLVASDLGVPVLSCSTTLKVFITGEDPSLSNTVGVGRRQMEVVGDLTQPEYENDGLYASLTEDDLALIATFGLATFAASGCVIAVVFCASRRRYRARRLMCNRRQPVRCDDHMATTKSEDIVDGSVCWISTSDRKPFDAMLDTYFSDESPVLTETQTPKVKTIMTSL